MVGVLFLQKLEIVFSHFANSSMDSAYTTEVLLAHEIKLFIRLGFAEMDIANNGREGVEYARQINYDLILMDINMHLRFHQSMSEDIDLLNTLTNTSLNNDNKIPIIVPHRLRHAVNIQRLHVVSQLTQLSVTYV